jgi:hypothetical protein
MSSSKGTSLIFSLLLAIAAQLVGCSCTSTRESARVAAPNGSLEAVWISISAGASSGYTHEVFIGPSGAPTAGSEMVLRCSKLRKMKISWLSANRVQLEFEGRKEDCSSKENVFVNGQNVSVDVVIR